MYFLLSNLLSERVLQTVNNLNRSMTPKDQDQSSSGNSMNYEFPLDAQNVIIFDEYLKSDEQNSKEFV